MSSANITKKVLKPKSMIITVGMSSSGKTTWARQYIVDRLGKHGENWVNINREHIRFNILLLAHGWSNYKTTVDNEKAVSKKARDLFFKAVENGDNIIISDCNLDKEVRDKWASLGRANGYSVEFKMFDITLEEAYKRDKHRGEMSVGREVLNRQWQQWRRCTGKPKYTPNPRLKNKVIFVDIESTLIDSDGNPRLFVCNLLSLYILRFDVSVIYVSNEMDVNGENRVKKTLFLKNSMGFSSQDILLMRTVDTTSNDYRTWKATKFWSCIGNNHVIAVVDGDQDSVNMWHDFGIKDVINVGDSRKLF